MELVAYKKVNDNHTFETSDANAPLTMTSTSVIFSTTSYYNPATWLHLVELD